MSIEEEERQNKNLHVLSQSPTVFSPTPFDGEEKKPFSKLSAFAAWFPPPPKKKEKKGHCVVPRQRIHQHTLYSKIIASLCNLIGENRSQAQRFPRSRLSTVDSSEEAVDGGQNRAPRLACGVSLSRSSTNTKGVGSLFAVIRISCPDRCISIDLVHLACPPCLATGPLETTRARSIVAPSGRSCEALWGGPTSTPL